GRDDSRGFVIRGWPGVRVLRVDHLGRHGENQSDKGCQPESYQAVRSDAATDGRESGTEGRSSGYGSASVTARNPTESSSPLISSPIRSPCAINASAARSMASLLMFMSRQSSMYA